MENYYTEQIEMLINTVLLLQENLNAERLDMQNNLSQSSEMASSMGNSKMRRFR